jgi:hypothetical protein
MGMNSTAVRLTLTKLVRDPNAADSEAVVAEAVEDLAAVAANANPAGRNGTKGIEQGKAKGR